jgi:hypothetical protein
VKGGGHGGGHLAGGHGGVSRNAFGKQGGLPGSDWSRGHRYGRGTTAGGPSAATNLASLCSDLLETSSKTDLGGLNHVTLPLTVGRRRTSET